MILVDATFTMQEIIQHKADNKTQSKCIQRNYCASLRRRLMWSRLMVLYQNKTHAAQYKRLNSRRLYWGTSDLGKTNLEVWRHRIPIYTRPALIWIYQAYTTMEACMRTCCCIRSCLPAERMNNRRTQGASPSRAQEVSPLVFPPLPLDRCARRLCRLQFKL